MIIIDALAANRGRRRFSRDAIGVGPRLLAGVLEKNNIETRIIRAEDFLSLTNKIPEAEAYLISAMTVDKIATMKSIKLIRKNTQGAKIILGGPILSEPNLENKIDFDIGVLGEGEIIINNLIQSDFKVGDLKENKEDGISFTEQGKTWIISKKFNSSANIFKQFSPSTERIIDYPDYWFSKVYVEVVRGCSNHLRGEIVQNNGGCSDCGNCDSPDSITQSECPENIPPGCGFCSVSNTYGGPISKSVKDVVKEVSELFEKGVRRIILSAPGFLDYFRDQRNQPIFSPTKPSANLEKIEGLLYKLAELRDNQKKVCSISVENVKPSLVTEETAKILGKYIPDTAISIGCETFDKTHSFMIGRPTNPNQALEATQLFKDNKLHPQIYLIHSLPGETVESINKTINTIKKDLEGKADKITVYRYQPLPNSPFTLTNSQLPIKRYILDKKRRELKNVIIEFNSKRKEEMIGKQIEVIVAERDVKRKSTYICYPILTGSAISIFCRKNILGKDIKLKIVRVLSDKLVEGEIISNS